MDKKQLRTYYRKLRSILTPQEIEERSMAIANQLLKIDIWNKTYYHLFLSITELREINTEYILQILMGKDKEIVISKDGNTSVITCSHILVATGRKANIENLQLENAGITTNKFGIQVNEHFQTNIPHIYAIGDCNGKWMLAHAATASAKYVLNHLRNKPNHIRFDLMPTCLYTHLQLAQVGKMESDFTEDAFIQTFKYPLRANAMAQATDQTEGMIKLIIQNNRLVGVAILHEQASTLIAVANEMIASNQSLEELNDRIVAHPTIAESLYEAVHQALKAL